MIQARLLSTWKTQEHTLSVAFPVCVFASMVGLGYFAKTILLMDLNLADGSSGMKLIRI